jgi:hypothetical protein
MYGNTFEMTQRQDHLYTYVQPLEAGKITFTGNDRKTYTNNLTRRDNTVETELQVFWDILILICIAFVTGACIYLSITLATQTAFNDVYLTQFEHKISVNHAETSNHIAYKMQPAGHIKPLPYIIIASLCMCSSIVIGWISNPDLILNGMWSQVVIFFIVLLQVWVAIFHSINYHNVRDFSYIQLSANAIFWLNLATIIITLLVTFYQSGFERSITGQKQQETVSTFWLTVAEDLNAIVAYVCVVSACNALGSVHDDTTIFFDVVCIVVIGFSQHIANVLMIFHAYTDACDDANNEKERQTVVTVIARTRLFIFFIIGVVVVIFFLRISPTYQEFTLGIPYEMLRVLAVVIMVSVGTLHSICYELQNATSNWRPWESSPAWKLMISAFVTFIFTLYILTNESIGKTEDVRNFLNNPATVPTVSTS